MANYRVPGMQSSFTLTLIDPCPTATYVLPVVAASYTYNLRAAALVVNLDNFVSSQLDTLCGTMVYKMKKNDGVTAIDSTVFTFSSWTTPKTLTISSSDNTKDGSYVLQYRAYQGTYTVNTQLVLLNIQIIDLCDNAGITKPAN